MKKKLKVDHSHSKKSLHVHNKIKKSSHVSSKSSVAENKLRNVLTPPSKSSIVNNHKVKSKGFSTLFALALVSVVLLVFSVVLNNMNILYFGLAYSIITVIMNISTRKNKVNKNKVVWSAKVEHHSKENERINSMKKAIAIKQEKYETDIDKLYNLVQKYKAVKFSEVAKLFGINNTKAEQWAKILESHELVEIHYPAFGEPQIRWKQ